MNLTTEDTEENNYKGKLLPSSFCNRSLPNYLYSSVSSVVKIF